MAPGLGLSNNARNLGEGVSAGSQSQDLFQRSQDPAKSAAPTHGEGFESQLNQFISQAVDPIMLASMVGAQATFGLSRIAFLKQLPKNFLGGSLGRWATANLSAFALEGMSFVGTHHGLSQMTGHPLPQDGTSLGQELKHTYLTLGLLKATGAVSSALLKRRLSGIAPAQLSRFDRFSQVVLPQASMFAGIYLSNALAPRLGLAAEMEAGENLKSSLITLGHFGVAGALLQRIPGWTAANQRIHLQTEFIQKQGWESLEKVSQKLFPSDARWVPEGITPEGIRVALDPTVQMSAQPQSGNGTPNGAKASTPVRPLATVNGKGKKGPSKKMAIVESVLGWVDRYTQLDLNRFTNPEQLPLAVNRANLPAPVESIEMGILLSIAGNNPGKRQLAYSRWVMDHTHHLPQTRQAYLEVEGKRLEFQKKIRERLDPLLGTFKFPDMAGVGQEIKSYERTAKEVLGAERPTLVADALLYLHHAEAMADTVYRANLTEADLIRMGYEPRSIQWTPQYAERFLPGAIETILKGNAELREAKGAEQVLQAARSYDPAEVVKTGENPYPEAFAEFLADPATARLWLSEVALHGSLRTLMRNNPHRFLERLAQDRLAEQPLPETELADRFSRFLESSERLDQEQSQQGLRGAMDLLARSLGQKDYQGLSRAKGDYEVALRELLTHHENELIGFAVKTLKKLQGERKWRPEQIQALDLARGRVMKAFEKAAAASRETLLSLESPINEFFEFYDAEMAPLREAGLRVGMAHVRELAQLIKKFLGKPKDRKDLEDALDKIEKDFERALDRYRKFAPGAARGRINPRDFNRTTEEALKKVMAAYEEVFKSAAKHGIDLEGPAGTRRIIPFFETYAHKPDLAAELPWNTKLNNVWQYARHALYRILRLNSVLHHDYPFQMGARQFLDFGASVGLHTQRQTFYTNPQLEPVLDYFNYAISGDHNTHLDFIGHADNIVQANLGERVRPGDIPDIIAKADLEIPVIETVFPHLTNRIPNDRVGILQTLSRATHMQAFGSLPSGRIRPSMPLAYDNVTMDVTNGEGPYVRDPHAPITGSLPALGRLYDTSEAAATITGRPQGMMFIQDPGAIRNYPSQRGQIALLRNPSSMLSLFLPLTGLPPPKDGKKITLRNNVQRLIWYLQGFHPVTDPAAPQTDAFYRGYEQPLDPMTENAVANLFQGVQEVYPTQNGLRKLERRRAELIREFSASANPNGPEARQIRNRVELTDQVLDLQTREIIGRELALLGQRLKMETQRSSSTENRMGATLFLPEILGRRHLLGKIEAKIQKGQKLSGKEKVFLAQAGAALAGRQYVAGRDPILEQLKFYYHMQDTGRTLKDGFQQARGSLKDFIGEWKKHHQNPKRPEFKQLGPYQAKGYTERLAEYQTALETLKHFQGFQANLADLLLDQVSRYRLRSTLKGLNLRIQQLESKEANEKEKPALRRIQRILRSRLKTLNRLEDRIRERPQSVLSKTEQAFMEKVRLAELTGEEIYLEDPVSAYLSFFLKAQEKFGSLAKGAQAAQRDFFDFIENWTPEPGSLHVSEALGFVEEQNNYQRALDTMIYFHGFTPQVADLMLDGPGRNRIRGTLTKLSQRLAEELPQLTDTPEYKGLRRVQRILTARLKTLDALERKISRGDTTELSKVERAFLEKVRAGGYAWGEQVFPRDSLIGQVRTFLNIRAGGKTLQEGLLEAQKDYYDFVAEWAEQRNVPRNPEHHQVHVSEARGYAEIWSRYRDSMEAILHFQGESNGLWQRLWRLFPEGKIFPDMILRREGEDLILEPMGWKPTGKMSRGALWYYLLGDTMGIVDIAKKLNRFDPTPDLYLTMHRGWGWNTLTRTQNRIRIQNSKKLSSLGDQPLIIGPTHDSGAEFALIPTIFHDYARRAFFVADRKFFDPFWGKKEISLFGKKFTIPFPQPPAFGLIRALLGPLEQYGHLAIDRSDRSKARQTMEDTGKFLNEKQRSVIIFPGGTRNEVKYGPNNERYEGPLYGNRPGIAMTMEASGAPILPLGLINGGIMFPKQAGDAFLTGGAMLGNEYVFNFGEPILFDQVLPGKAKPKGPALRNAVVQELNRQFPELTGREMDLPSGSKAKEKESQKRPSIPPPAR